MALITLLYRFAERAAMYRALRTLARPPRIERLPRFLPLSQLKGATPTSDEIFLRSSCPRSGNSANKVVAVTGPTPGTERRRLSFSRHTTLFLSWSSSSLSNSFCSASSQAMCFLSLGWMDLWVVWRRFFSAASISTIWRRLTRAACSSMVCSSGITRGSGRVASPKWANTEASILSVLARRPSHLAKSRTWRGLKTATGSLTTGIDTATAVSYPPVASNTIEAGVKDSIFATRRAIPSLVFLTCHCSPDGRIAISKNALLTSIPTYTDDPSLSVMPTPNKIRLVPTLPDTDSRSRQLFGLRLKGMVTHATNRF